MVLVCAWYCLLEFNSFDIVINTMRSRHQSRPPEGLWDNTLGEFEEHERPEWHAKAACRGVGTDLFFPDTADGVAVKKVKQAREDYCNGCAVSGDCLEFAFTSFEMFGVWGGASRSDRINIIEEYKQA